MSGSKIISQEKIDAFISTKTLTEERDENFPENNQDNDIEDRYVRGKCTHDSCDQKSGRVSDPKIDPEIGKEVGGKQDINLEDTHGCELDERLGANDFTDTECGEPMQSQLLRIDFTPIDGIDDNPHIQKKCSDFWKFISSQPQLKGLIVLPVKEYEEVVAASSSKSSLKKCKHVQTPAVVDWLEAGVGQKLAFTTKHQSKYCHHYNGDYMEASPPKNRETDTQARKNFDRGSPLMQ